MASEAQTIPVRIEGIDSPVRACPGPDGVAIGVQRGPEMVDKVPSSTAAPSFDLAIEAVPGESGPDFRGPYVHGGPGDRFLYLAWVGIRDGGLLARIKLKLGDIDPGLIAESRAGGTLVARLRLVNDLGKPVSGSVRPPDVEWFVE